MRIAGIVQDSIVDGPGFRCTVFTQGCYHNCAGCHNMQTHDPEGGKEMPVKEVFDEIMENPLTDGVTFSGGEPFLQASACAELAQLCKKEGLNIWAYTGYTFEELLSLSKSKPEILDFLHQIDILIDGRFVLSEKSYDVVWRGSKNQRIIQVKDSLESGCAVLSPEN